jgi:hypothetical protein
LDKLKVTYPDGAHGLMRAMFIALIGERAKQAKDFLAWGLRPNPIHRESRLARDNASVTLEDEPNLVSSTALRTRPSRTGCVISGRIQLWDCASRLGRSPAPRGNSTSLSN